MITIIQGTNRPDSNTEYVSRQISYILGGLYEGEIGHIRMAGLPGSLFRAGAYDEDSLPAALRDIQDRWMAPADKFIWLLPEYNGSFPGIVKLFIDVISVRKCDETFLNKKSMLIGIATGRSGNIRGMDHMAGILMHMKSVIYPKLLPVSRVHDLMDESGHINHEPTLRVLRDYLSGFVAF